MSASIGANPDMVVTANIEVDGKKTLTKGMRKYGDRFGRIALFVMHSSTYFDIIDQAIAAKIYEEAGVVVYGGQPGTLGKPVLVTDTAPIDAIFGLLPNAVVITESQAPASAHIQSMMRKTSALATAQRGLSTSTCLVIAGTKPTAARIQA